MSHREDMERRVKEEARAHDHGCSCTTCRAAAGDDEAMKKLLNELV